MNQLEKDVKALEDKEEAQREQERKAKVDSEREVVGKRRHYFITQMQQRFGRLLESTEILWGDGNWVAFKYKGKDYFVVLAEVEVPYGDDLGTYTTTEYHWVIRQKHWYNNYNAKYLVNQYGIENKSDWYQDVVKALKELTR